MLSKLRQIPNLPRWCLLGWFLGLTSQINITLIVGTFASKLVELQLAPTYTSFQKNIATWTESDVAHYYAHLGFDLVHPIIYGLALTVNLAWGFRAAGVSSRYNVWLVAPLVAGILDEVENYAHYVAVSMYQPHSKVIPDFPWWTFGIGCTAAKIKWLLVLGTIVALSILAWSARQNHVVKSS